ncbi:hypothetical protein BH11CYA1_BH11CYA1_22320 [soil metagenome]
MVARKLVSAQIQAQIQARIQKKSATLAALLALSLQFSTLTASASPVEMKQADGKPVQATLALPVPSIGSMLLPDGQISVNGQLVEVGAVPEWLFDRHTVLTGALIRLDLGAAAVAVAPPAAGAASNLPSAGTAVSSPQSRLDGLVYFNGGDWLKNLRRNRISETVEALDGNSYVGRISTVTANDLTIDTLPGQSRTIALANVKNIVSPFAFRFSALASDVKLSPESGMTVCDASTASFALAQPLGSTGSAALSSQPRPRMFGIASQPVLKLPKSTLAGTEGGISKKAITAMVTVDAANTLAPMIALPLTMALGQGRAENTLNGYTAANRLNDFFLHIPLVTSPTAKF